MRRNSWSLIRWTLAGALFATGLASGGRRTIYFDYTSYATLQGASISLDPLHSDELATRLARESGLFATDILHDVKATPSPGAVLISFTSHDASSARAVAQGVADALALQAGVKILEPASNPWIPAMNGFPKSFLGGAGIGLAIALIGRRLSPKPDPEKVSLGL